MSSTSEKSDYLLLFRGMDWYQDVSPEVMQKTMTEWMTWFNRLVAEGRCKGGQSLGMEGKTVVGKMRNVTDGPFAEAKEAVAGYFLLHVKDMDEALEIAKECPTLGFGTIVEVRPLMARCKASELAAMEPAVAQA